MKKLLLIAVLVFSTVFARTQQVVSWKLEQMVVDDFKQTTTDPGKYAYIKISKTDTIKLLANSGVQYNQKDSLLIITRYTSANALWNMEIVRYKIDSFAVTYANNGQTRYQLHLTDIKVIASARVKYEGLILTGGPRMGPSLIIIIPASALKAKAGDRWKRYTYKIAAQ